MLQRALEPVRRHTLGSEVTHALREAILSGVYQPGDHLTEAQIAREMQVSHGPVREALRELEAEELIVIEAHRGAFVKAFTADDVREIYSMRSALETAMTDARGDRSARRSKGTTIAPNRRSFHGSRPPSSF